MGEAPFLPRRIELERLVEILVKEHKIMREGLGRAKDAAARGDLRELSRELKELDPVFRQHISDEEGQVLRLLIDKLGVRGAEDEIRVFQQHRPIYRLMQEISELAAMPAAELESAQTRLNDLFDQHTRAEEQRVFPRAMSIGGPAGG